MTRNFFRIKSRYDFVANIIVFLFALVMLFPMYWMFSNALKPSHTVTLMPPEWVPKNITFANFYDLIFYRPIGLWMKNSFVISLGTTVLVVITSSMAAYAFAKLRFKGRNIIFFIFISTLMIPKEVYIIPLFRQMQLFRLSFTTIGIILPSVAAPFGVFILKQFFDTLPDDLRESARIDGCNEFTVFSQIFMPMARAGIGALFILMFVRAWNDYLWQLIMVNRDADRTLQLGIAAMQQEIVPNMAFRLTGASLAAIPMIIVFLAFQRYFTQGITLGALKE